MAVCKIQLKCVTLTLYSKIQGERSAIYSGIVSFPDYFSFWLQRNSMGTRLVVLDYPLEAVDCLETVYREK